MWQGWSRGLVHCPGGNAINPIWRVLASSDGISGWTSLKPQHSIPCWLSVQWEPSIYGSCQGCQKKGSSKVCGWIVSVWSSCVLENQHTSTGNSISWSLGHSSRSSFHRMALFPSLKQNFISYRSSKVFSRPDCIFEIHQLWQSGFRRVFFDCCCNCSFEPELIKIGQSSHRMYGNNILNFQESTTMINACQIKSGNQLNAPRKSQQNSKFWLCGDRDETFNHIISECSKLTQKVYKKKHDWMGKVIHTEMCKKCKFDHTNKWYIHSPNYVKGNEKHKLLWDLSIRSDHIISTRQPAFVFVAKKLKLMNSVFVVPLDRWVKTKGSEKRDKFLHLVHPNDCIIENGQNTKKSAEDLRRFVVLQAPVKDNQRTLMRKTLKE